MAYGIEEPNPVCPAMLPRLTIAPCLLFFNIAVFDPPGHGLSDGAYSAAMCIGALADRIMGLILIEVGYLTMKQKGKTAESEIGDILEWMRTFHFDSWDKALEAIKSEVIPWTEYDEAEFYASLVERMDGWQYIFQIWLVCLHNC